MSSRMGWIQVEWLDGKIESHFGRARIIDTGGGVLVISEEMPYSGGDETVKLSTPLAGLRKWTPAEHA